MVRIHGKMREAVVFGQNLELTREISTVLGEKSIHIYDRIENLSVDPSPLMFVYHCNPASRCWIVDEAVDQQREDDGMAGGQGGWAGGVPGGQGAGG